MTEEMTQKFADKVVDRANELEKRYNELLKSESFKTKIKGEAVGRLVEQDRVSDVFDEAKLSVVVNEVLREVLNKLLDDILIDEQLEQARRDVAVS